MRPTQDKTPAYPIPPRWEMDTLPVRTLPHRLRRTREETRGTMTR